MCYWKGFTIPLQWNQAYVKYAQGGFPVTLTAMSRKESVWKSANRMLLLLNKTLFLSSIITTDESWIILYDPESKQQSSVQKHKDPPPPKIFRTS
jgi:hypothetical protein